MQRASGLWLLLVGLWVGGTFLAAQAAYIDERARQRHVGRVAAQARRPSDLGPGLNPALAWSQLTFRFPASTSRSANFRDELIGRWAHRLEDILPSLYGVALYGFLAWAFYRLAAWRFEREGEA